MPLALRRWEGDRGYGTEPGDLPSVVVLPAASGMASGKMRCDLARILSSVFVPEPARAWPWEDVEHRIHRLRRGGLRPAVAADLACAGRVRGERARARAAASRAAAKTPRPRLRASISCAAPRRSKRRPTCCSRCRARARTESGGYGSFASVSLRGNEPSHTTFWLGAVPLNDPESGTFDVSLLPLVAFRAARGVSRRRAALALAGRDCRRGAARAARRRRAAGSRRRARRGLVRVAAGVCGRARAAGVRAARLSWFTSAQATHSDADYPYVDDRKTRFDASDDVELRLRNAEVTEASGLSHLRAPLLGGELEAVAFGIRRLGGAPGAAGLGSNALQTQRSLLLATASTRVHVPRARRGRARLRAAAAAERALHRQRAVRPVRRARLRRGARARRHAAARLRAARGQLRAHAVPRGERDRELRARRAASSDDELRNTALASFARSSAAGALELRLFGAPLGRASELRARRAPRARASTPRCSRSCARATTRSSARRRPTAPRSRPSSGRGSSCAARSARARAPPSAAELFGDGVAVRPNTLLRARERALRRRGLRVRSRAGRAARERRADRVPAGRRRQDRLPEHEPVRDGRDEPRPRATSAASRRAASSRCGSGPRLVVTTTMLHTRGPFDRQLPLRPRLRAYGMLEQSLRLGQPWAERLTLFIELEHEGTVVLRPGERGAAPAR